MCDHANTMKTAEQGLSQLPQLLVTQVSNYLKYRFLFSQAFSCFVQHKYTEAVDLFQRILKITTDQKIKLETVRYLIECSLCADRKQEAINLYESNTGLDPICELLVEYYSETLKLASLFES